MSYASLTESSSLTFTSAATDVIDLTNIDHLLSIFVLSPDDVYSYNIPEEYPVSLFTSNATKIIDLTDIDHLLSIYILSPGEVAQFSLKTPSSVLLALRQILTIDFVSITSFNATETLDFDAPQYWIGA